MDIKICLLLLVILLCLCPVKEGLFIEDWASVDFSIESNDKGWKDEFVLVLVSLPILVLVYSIFTDDPEIRNRLDLFFEYFKNLPYWYQAIFIGIVSAIYGLKGADIMRKK